MNDNFPSIDIIICAYNNIKTTKKCLDSVYNLKYPNYNIILVDDCSNKGVVDTLKREYPKILIIENSKRLGPARARNKGITVSQAEYIVTMDNDASLSDDWLDKMVDLMEIDKEIAQAVGKILFSDDQNIIAASGGSIQHRGKAYDIGYGKNVADSNYNKTRQVLYACSASMIVRREALNHVGGFYDVYYHGYEDVDLSFKLNIAGYKVIYFPQAISYHALSKTVNQIINNKRTYYWIRNRLLIILRNYQLKSLIKYIPANLKFTAFDCYKHPKRILAAFKSWLWIIFNFYSILKERRKTNKFRTKNDQELHLLFNLI